MSNQLPATIKKMEKEEPKTKIEFWLQFDNNMPVRIGINEGKKIVLEILPETELNFSDGKRKFKLFCKKGY